ncbi:hypothetical protein ACTPEM_25465, partial [Clostridioides difficile]
ATKFNGDTSKMFSRAGKGLSIALGCAMVICIGPLLAIPRTAARLLCNNSYEYMNIYNNKFLRGI